MAKITGIPPVPRGRYWERLLDGKIEPASDQDRQRLTAAGLSTWPIAFELHESGSRFAVPNAAMTDGRSDGDFIDVPATPYGNDVLIGPAVVISGTLIDNTGQKRYIYRKGVIAEDVNGEWNINSAMTGDVLPVGNNAGGNTPAGALTMNNVGVDVPSMAAFNAAAGRIAPLEERPYIAEFATGPAYTVVKWSNGLMEIFGYEAGGQLAPGVWTIISWPLAQTFLNAGYTIAASVAETRSGALGGAVFETAEAQPLDERHATLRCRNNHSGPLSYGIHYRAIGRWK